MTSNSTNFLIQVSIVAGVWFLTLHTVNGIKCFQCNSARDAGCAQLIDNSTDNIYYKECESTFIDPKDFFCRTIIQIIKDRDNLVRVVRSCGWERHPRLNCYENEDEDHREIVCQCFTDGCNSRASYSVTSSILTILLCVSLVTKLYV